MEGRRNGRATGWRMELVARISRPIGMGRRTTEGQTGRKKKGERGAAGSGREGGGCERLTDCLKEKKKGGKRRSTQQKRSLVRRSPSPSLSVCPALLPAVLSFWQKVEGQRHSTCITRSQQILKRVRPDERSWRRTHRPRRRDLLSPSWRVCSLNATR